MNKFLKLVALGFSCWFLGTPSGQAQSDPKNVGIVLLHGKWGAPHGNIKSLSEALRANGYEVTAPFMPWSTKRSYDAPYQDAIDEIDAVVKKYRAQGLGRVYVMGTSFGANASIAYAAYGKQAIDGVVAIAPGHLTDTSDSFKLFGRSLALANDMIKDGKGEEVAIFQDVNGGKRRDFSMKASTYASYFDPKGMGAMSVSAKKVTQPVPIAVLLGGAHDYSASLGKAYFYNSWPIHPKNVYTTLEGAEHTNAPEFAIDTVLKWLSEPSK